MPDSLKLMCVLAHPDDESLGNGGILARYAAEGVETTVLTATRGERGWFGKPEDNPGQQALGHIREKELLAAAEVLGVREVHFLDYVDGDLDQADPQEAIARIVPHLRRARPQVVVSFGPEGAYGHPDHIAISQLTAAALVCAADPGYPGGDGLPPHGVSKYYYMVNTPEEGRVYESVFGELVMNVDGVERRVVPTPEWMISARVDTWAYHETIWKAIHCHQSQSAAYNQLESLSEEKRRVLWGTRGYVRAFSTVNGGRAVETDLFEGLR